MFHDDGCALLIGINDYHAFDLSMNRPEGTSDLPGSVLDAHMFWRLCIQAGMKPANIRVAASPRPDLSMLPGATQDNLVDATEASLRDALRWLSGKLAAGRVGLLTYSGHGAHTREQGLLLCPSDTVGASFTHAIPFRELRSALSDGAKNLTVVLDCCHAGSPSGAPGRRPSTLGGDAVQVGERVDEMLIGARVLAACRPGETTQQATFGGAPHGSFSWAIGAIVEQWKAIGEGRNVRLDLSYGTLVDKARQLLAVLEFAGTPALYGPPDVGSLAVMQLGARSEKTSATPDGARMRVQMDPGQKQVRYYTLTDARGGVANVLVPRVDGSIGGVAYSAAKEYWFNVSLSTPSRQLTVSWADYDWSDRGLPDPRALSFTMTRAPSWDDIGTTEPPTGSDTFASDSPPVALHWGLVCSAGVWGGFLKWYNTTGQNSVFSGALPAGGVVLSSSPSYPRGQNWFKVRLSPQPPS